MIRSLIWLMPRAWTPGVALTVLWHCTVIVEMCLATIWRHPVKGADPTNGTSAMHEVLHVQHIACMPVTPGRS